LVLSHERSDGLFDGSPGAAESGQVPFVLAAGLGDHALRRVDLVTQSRFGADLGCTSSKQLRLETLNLVRQAFAVSSEIIDLGGGGVGGVLKLLRLLV
jgi:hypothetical protein